jgi:inositol 1,4,5-triphosphate receptor type 1
LTEQVERSREKEEDRQLSVKVSVMQPILRFLQLLCENHNKQLQNLLRWGFSNQNQSSWIRIHMDLY